MKKNNQHRTLDGNLIDPMSQECLEDLNIRIEDATFSRDCCPHGTASRIHYNGLLSLLRKHRKKIIKKLDYESTSHELDEDDSAKSASWVNNAGGKGQAQNTKDISFSNNSGNALRAQSSPTAEKAMSQVSEMKTIKEYWSRLLK